MVSAFWPHRELIFTLVKRDLKIRYKASALGFLWSFGRPLAMMVIMWAVFAHFIGVARAHPELPYALQLLSGILPWMFLTGSLFEAQGSVLANGHIVKKISIQTIVFPAAAVVGNLVHLILAMGLLVLFAVALDVSIGWEVLFLPFLMLLQTGMLMGLALILSSLMVFYRDVGNISEIVIMGWFYLTPIIYPVQMARDHFRAADREWLYWVYMANPMTPIICAYRRVLFGPAMRNSVEISDHTLLLGLGISTAFTLAVLLIGFRMFRALSSRFSDEL